MHSLSTRTWYQVGEVLRKSASGLETCMCELACELVDEWPGTVVRRCADGSHGCGLFGRDKHATAVGIAALLVCIFGLISRPPLSARCLAPPFEHVPTPAGAVAVNAELLQTSVAAIAHKAHTPDTS